MQTITGDFGTAVFAASTDAQGASLSRYMSLNTQAALLFFRRYAVEKPNLTANSMGLYTLASVGRNGKARFGSLSVPKHLLQSRKNGCGWHPKGNMKFGIDEFDVCPVEYNGEQCPDALYGDCLEKILGVGNEVRDMLATPEGRALFMEMVRNIYMGLGNSVYDLVTWGKHPLIADATEQGLYTVDDQEWDDFVDQQEACVGHMTLIDQLKADGYNNYNVDILDADVSADRMSYTGNVGDLFDRVLAAQSPTMKLVSRRVINNSNIRESILLVTPQIFAKYEDELLTAYPQLPSTFQYFYNGKFCENMGCDPMNSVTGVLKYKGHLVVRMDEWEEFDDMVGVKTFRVMAIVPGNLGIAFDVPALSQFAGMGLRINQRLDAPYQGKVYMDTTFKIGTGILDQEFIVNASKVYVPAT